MANADSESRVHLASEKACREILPLPPEVFRHAREVRRTVEPLPDRHLKLEIRCGTVCQRGKTHAIDQVRKIHYGGAGREFRRRGHGRSRVAGAVQLADLVAAFIGRWNPGE